MINSIVIGGNLCREPEVKVTNTNKKYATFTIAVNNGKRDGKELPPDFINCTVWDKTADFIESYAHKGVKVVVSGALKTRVYETQNGKQTYTYVLGQSVDLMSREPKYQQDTLVGGGQSVAGGRDNNFKSVTLDELTESDNLPFY